MAFRCLLFKLNPGESLPIKSGIAVSDIPTTVLSKKRGIHQFPPYISQVIIYIQDDYRAKTPTP